MKICAITGASGWVGSCVARHFRVHGWQVRELTRAAGYTLDAEVPAGLLDGVTALVHCAYDFSPLRREEIDAVNVAGSRRLFEAARTAGVRRLVFISTMSAFEGCRSLYGQAKLAIERDAREHGALVLRPGLVFGAGAGGMVGRLEKQVQSSRVVPLIGDGRQPLYLIHEEDLSAFIRRFAEDTAPAPVEAITAAHPQLWTFRAILEALAARQSRRLTLIPLPWQLLWLALKTAESLGLRPSFRSDSLLSLMNQNPAPDFSVPARHPLTCRPFAVASMPSK
jgi:nucleoside-diphosphate-sugar epimerase